MISVLLCPSQWPWYSTKRGTRLWGSHASTTCMGWRPAFQPWSSPTGRRNPSDKPHLRCTMQHVFFELELQHSTDSSRRLLGDAFTFPLSMMKDWKFDLPKIQRKNFDVIPSLQELEPWYGWIVPLCSTSTGGEEARKSPWFLHKPKTEIVPCPCSYPRLEEH